MSTENPESQVVDRTPTGSKQNAAIPSGEVFQEYGIVDLHKTFPAESYEWEDEMIDPDHPPDREKHLIVPFRVVKRGLKTLRIARSIAEDLSEEHGGEYKAVLLSDMRGM